MARADIERERTEIARLQTELDAARQSATKARSARATAEGIATGLREALAKVNPS